MSGSGKQEAPVFKTGEEVTVIYYQSVSMIGTGKEKKYGKTVFD